MFLKRFCRIRPWSSSSNSIVPLPARTRIARGERPEGGRCGRCRGRRARPWVSSSAFANPRFPCACRRRGIPIRKPGAVRWPLRRFRCAGSDRRSGHPIRSRARQGPREPLNKGATPPRNSPISEGALNLQASKLDLISDSLDLLVRSAADSARCVDILDAQLPSGPVSAGFAETRHCGDVRSEMERSGGRGRKASATGGGIRRHLRISPDFHPRPFAGS